MFGMGMSEILIICGVALLVFGPQQLPEMAKKIAKGLKEVRRASDDLKRSIHFDDDDERPRWQPPVPRPPLMESGSAAFVARDRGEELELAPTIPGSALAHGSVDDSLASATGIYGESSDGVPLVLSAAPVSLSDPVEEPEGTDATITKET